MKRSIDKALISFISIGALLAATPTPEAFAQKVKEKASNARSQKSLETSKRIKFKDKTSVDFDAAAIDGQAKNPFGSIVQSRDQGFDKGFIKIRTNWHDQMVMSLSGLSGN